MQSYSEDLQYDVQYKSYGPLLWYFYDAFESFSQLDNPSPHLLLLFCKQWAGYCLKFSFYV